MGEIGTQGFPYSIFVVETRFFCSYGGQRTLNKGFFLTFCFVDISLRPRRIFMTEKGISYLDIFSVLQNQKNGLDNLGHILFIAVNV